MRELVPGSDQHGPSRALVIAPVGRLSGELAALLRREAPLSVIDTVERYPAPTELRALAARPGLRLCFVDAGADAAAAGETIAALCAEAPAVPVVAVLPGNDPDLILRCLRQGAAEFLIPPFTAEQIRSALAKAAKSQPPTPDTGGGRLIAVLPGKGASGATTLALNLAFALKRLRGVRILLADLDGLTGTLAFLLKLKSTYSFVDALAQPGGIDADIWKALVLRADGVDLLLSPESPLDGIGPAADPRPLLDYARLNYDLVVADLSGAFGEWNTAVARLAADLIIVTTTELAALHATQRALAWLEHTGGEPPRLVVNRYRQHVGLAPAEIATALGTPAFHTLPSEYEVIHKALLEGKPAPASSKYGSGVAELAKKLCGNNLKTGAD